MPLTSGTRLGHYEIISRLGVGGMGEVYSARDLHLGRTVAIKILAERLVKNEDALRRFEREAQAVASLTHPNIVDIHDFVKEIGLSYAVMELLDGETLRERIARSPLAWRKALEIAVPVAEGLAAAHSKRVIHRDLKPENIFLTSNGQVKILDFGLARLIPEISDQDLTEAPTFSKLTESGILLGTIPYLSPEQVRGKTADERSDIFTFGSVLYEMITGHRPFRGGTPSETIAAILRDDPPQLSGVPPELNRLLHRCLEKNPEERLQSARDLVWALKDLQGGSGISQRDVIPTSSHRFFPGLRMLVPLLAVIVLIAAFSIFLQKREKSTPASKKFDSVAVLPLANLSGDSEQEYFADGMTEALITDLAKIRNLKVISRSSVMQFKNTRKPIREIAQKLGVGAVVEGSVICSEGRVRITAQLIDATTDTHLWAESYERDLREVLALQSEVARAIAREIKATLAPGGDRGVAPTRTVSPEAHEAYLRGRFEWEKRTRDSLGKAEMYFQQAIEKDPTFALAYAGLAETYYVLGSNGYRAPAEVFPRAMAAGLKALEIDENFGEARAVKATILYCYNYDFREANIEFRRAIELSPGYATAHHWYAMYLSDMGRAEEAIVEIRKAAELDPLSPRIAANIGMILYSARRYDQAIRELQRTLQSQPENVAAQVYLAENYLQERMLDHAIKEYETATSILPDHPPLILRLGHAYAVSGNTGKALNVLQQVHQLSERMYIDPVALAIFYTGLGDQEKAVAFLEEAFRNRSDLLTSIKVEPRFDPLRSQPRFQDLLRRMKFPE